jgi:hypothetical protein
MTGATLSTTVTLNVQVRTLPVGSVAVYVTAVTPTGNVAPGEKLLVSVALQLSVAVGGVHVTTLLQVDVVTETLAGHPEMTGCVTSFTTTLNVQVDWRPDASVAVYVTAVVPTGKNCPGVLLLVIVTAQLSVTLGGVQLTVVPHVPVVVLAFTVSVPGQLVITGLFASFTTTLKVQVAVLPDASVAV